MADSFGKLCGMLPFKQVSENKINKKQLKRKSKIVLMFVEQKGEERERNKNNFSAKRQFLLTKKKNLLLALRFFFKRGNPRLNSRYLFSCFFSFKMKFSSPKVKNARKKEPRKKAV